MCVTSRSRCGVAFASLSDEEHQQSEAPQETKSESSGGFSASSRTLCSTGTPPPRRGSHVPEDPSRVGGRAPEVPRAPGPGMDQGGDPPATSRTPRTRRRTEQEVTHRDNPPGDDSRDEKGEQDQGQPRGPLRDGTWDAVDGERDQTPARDEGNEQDHVHCPGGGHGPGGVWQARGAPVPRDPRRVLELRRMGSPDSPGEPQHQRPSPATPRGVAGAKDASTSVLSATGNELADGGACDMEAHAEDPGQGLLEAQDGPLRVNHVLARGGRGSDEEDGGNGRDDPQAPGRAGEHEGRTPSEAEGLRQRGHHDGPLVRGGHGTAAVSEDEDTAGRVSQGLSSQEVDKLGLQKAKSLEERSSCVVPEIFQALTGYNRPVLMECGSRSHSTLAARVCELSENPEAAMCCGQWNSCDLSTTEGLKLQLERIRLERPQHVWMSPSCGSYTALQNLNNKSPEQKAQILEQRQLELRGLVGMSCVVNMCKQKRIHVTVEIVARTKPSMETSCVPTVVYEAWLVICSHQGLWSELS